MNAGEASIGFVSLALSLLVFYLTRDFPAFHARGVTLPGPSFFPNFVASLLLTCAALQFLRAYREGRAAKAQGQGLPGIFDTVRTFTRSPGAATILIITLATVFYGLLLDRLGFQLTTLLLLVTMMLRMEVPALRAGIYAVVLVAIMALIFDRMFHVPLPYGVFHL